MEHAGSYQEIGITDINGIKAGHAQDFQAGTGCTAIICEEGACAGVDVGGGGPASRETDLLRPGNLVQAVHCIMLSGGSAYGLEAGSGAMQYLEERGVGLPTRGGLVPIVCGASLFDLGVGDPRVRPDKAMGYEACKNAESGSEPAMGSVGAGTGATVGKLRGPDYMMKSGLGIYGLQLGRVQCAAIAAVNAFGDVIDYDTHRPLAGLLRPDKSGIGSTHREMLKGLAAGESAADNDFLAVQNTTLGVIVTNAKLTQAQCGRLARIAQDGYARAIIPVHTSIDGDMIFVLATGQVSVSQDALGELASEVMARAICRAAASAKPAFGLKAACDFMP